MANIVICCDGTWNTPDQLDKGVPAPTNVVRLHNAVAETDAKGAPQEKYYHPGVGTSGKWWDKAIGGGTGAGLDDNIKSAYQKLCYNYKQTPISICSVSVAVHIRCEACAVSSPVVVC